MISKTKEPILSFGHNPADGPELRRREAESWQSFLQKLHCLRIEQQSFSTLPVTAHAVLLSDFAARSEANQDKLARMMCEEVGRCLCERRAELSKSVELIRYYARLAPELLAHKTIATQASLSQVRFEPLGVALAVMSWNYPIWQVLRFAIPALHTGNVCAVKPAPNAPRVTIVLFDIIGSGLPVIPARLDELDILKVIEHTDVMTLIGSTFISRLLAAYAGAHLKKSMLGLGGSNAPIVMPDIDLAQAVKEACYSRSCNVGQSCNAAKRIIVAQAVAEKPIPPFLVECAKLKTGNSLDADMTLVPPHCAGLRLRVHEQMEDALDSGAEYLLGGIIPDGSGWFHPATVLGHANPSCHIYREEVSGPVAILLRAKDATHAAELVNDSPFGLDACTYTADTAKAWCFAEEIRAGSVFTNCHISSDLRLSLDGVKDSGYGRELSESGLYEFVSVKAYW